MPEMPQSMQKKGLQNTQQDLTVSTSQLFQKISPKDCLLRLRIKTGYLQILITGYTEMRNKLSINMTFRQGIVPSLILVPIRSGLRGFCLFILEIFLLEYQQKNPLKYYTLPVSFEFVNIFYLTSLLRVSALHLVFENTPETCAPIHSADNLMLMYHISCVMPLH